ncbi:MAG: anaerobic sulfatase maturase [Proteobacteria bacterium]|nr:anaerobic sulfatase maturase [Pseudomonadota bacterium]
MTTEQTKVRKQKQSSAQGIHVVAKPIGPACNLNCEYCFYLEKQALFSEGEQYEPTLLGIDFFRRVIELQRPFLKQKTISNSLQTNGTLLTDEWCAFLKANGFMVGISLDGPKEIHDRYRRDRSGNGTFDTVMQGLRLLQKHKVEYNVLACVARETALRPLEVYQFFRGEGIDFIQFAPVVERLAEDADRDCGLRLASPATLDQQEENTQVTPWSVTPEDYGDFLIAVYEEWVRHDVGKLFVMNFEWALNAWIGNPSPVCIHAKQCGLSLVIEHSGDVYACDHCVYPQYKLGNIMTDELSAMVEKSLQSGFGTAKETALPRWCRECAVLTACQGGCPKHRFAKTCDNEPGLQYLCAGYNKFFLHIRKYLRTMTQLLENGLPASYVMQAVKGPLVVKLDGI